MEYKSKLPVLQSVIYNPQVDCFCVTETWLKQSSVGKEILESINYSMYTCDRSTKVGAVLTAVGKHISFRRTVCGIQVEVVVVELGLCPVLCLCCMYRFIKHSS